ncbi:MAG TPA: endonuclease, partial [Giesbergeria sp.]|nr:endonuclease [Giesbergeria sp.]
PLYIGKSINLRNRLLAHLRTPDEARMLRQTRRISHIRTAGEIGALLLEAKLIKELHPLFNQKLRRSRQLCALRMNGDRPEVVYAKDIQFATESGLYGLFNSHRAAQEGLRKLADQHKLCYGALGLEKLPPGKACFRAMLHQCAGVCRGDESPNAHRQRLFTALLDLQIATWPYPGTVGLVERFTPERNESALPPHANDVQIHVLRHWCYLGSVSKPEEASALDCVAAGFDADGYKILCKPLLSGRSEIILL